MVGFMFLLSGCGSAVSVSDLKANDWLVDTKDDETPNMIVSFSDHIMSFKVDMSSIGSSAEDEWEALGEELAKQIFDQMNFKLEYELNKDELKVQDADDNKEYVYYKVTKEDKNIVLTPDKEKNSDDDQEKLVLEPYNAPKEKDSSTAQSSAITDASTDDSLDFESFDTSDDVDESDFQTSVTYSENTLTTPDGIITFTGATEDRSIDDEKAITILFDYQNTTDETQNVEYILWDYLQPKQVLDSTTESLSTLMHDEDSSNYEEYHNTQVEINPGATVSCAYSYVLVDESKALTIDLMDDDFEVIGTREYE